jgi:hypothetical protein
MEISTERTYNIFAELINDGAGDYAWVETLVKFLKNNGVPDEKIRIIVLHASDYGDDLNTIVLTMFRLYNDELKPSTNCSIASVDNIDGLKENSAEVITYVFEKNDSLANENKFKIFGDNLYLHDKYNYASDFKDIKNIVNNILNGIVTDPSKIEVGNYVCRVSKEIIKNIEVPDSLLTIRESGNPGYPINMISNFTRTFQNIPIYYFGILKCMDLSGLFDIDDGLNTTNMNFKTQGDDDCVINNAIKIREGGHDEGGSINCSIQYGYVQAVAEGNEEDFKKYMESKSLTAKNTCVSYISLGNNKHALKLSKFIKILCYSADYDYPTNKYSILMTNSWNEIFSADRSKLDTDIEIISKDTELVKVKFNNKELDIVKGSRITIEDTGFNFAYLLQQTNDYCLLSGDNSYMEGLTLNKKVIHVGMVNKYNMIQELQTRIAGELSITNLVPYKSMDETHEAPESRRSVNDKFKNYADYISNGEYKNKQRPLVSEDFLTSLKNAIIEKQLLTGGFKNEHFQKNEYKNKYLKYKQKYLYLKNKINN